MWSQILGHKRQIEQLKKAISVGQFPNAFLFSGLGGIGKHLVATTFCQGCHCEDSTGLPRPVGARNDVPCGTCIPCSKIKNRMHPDVFFVEPVKGNILIEQIRELRQNLQFHPLEGPLKMAIINDAEAMTESAANSLLKILEEPPPKTHFILISAFANSLLPTIRSRCQKLSFSPLSEDDVVLHLTTKAEIDEKNARYMAKISAGSIGAIAMLDIDFMEEVLGRFKNIVKKANAADIIALAEEWSKEEERAPLIFDLLANFYHDILCRDKKDERNFNDFTAIVKARDALTNTNVNKQLLFEQLLFTLIV